MAERMQQVKSGKTRNRRSLNGLSENVTGAAKNGKYSLADQPKTNIDVKSRKKLTSSRRRAVATSLPRTPRRIKDPLANLLTTLSPKCTQFTTTPSSTDSQRRSRSLRRQFETDIRGFTKSMTTSPVAGYVRRAVTLSPRVAHKTPRKHFVSPIEKLLLKNGSTSPFSGFFGKAAIKPDVIEASAPIKFSKPVEKETARKIQVLQVGEVVDLTEDSEVTSGVESADTATTDNLSTAKPITSEKEPDPNKDYSSCLGEQEFYYCTELDNETAVEEEEEPVVEVLPSNNSEVISTAKQQSELRDNNSEYVESIDEKRTENNCHQIEDCTSPRKNVAASETLNSVEEAASPGNQLPSANSPSTISFDSAHGSSVTTEGSVERSTFAAGELYWGKLLSYVYWPCMVAPDPDTSNIVEYKKQQQWVHVYFLADNSRHNWVKGQNMIAFTGLEQYQEIVDQVKEKHGVRSDRYKVFLPKPTQEAIWQKAVREAEVMTLIPMEQRMMNFNKLFPPRRQIHRRLTVASMRRPSSSIGSRRSLAPSDCGSVKRDRSLTPESPAFSPIKARSPKKQRLGTTAFRQNFDGIKVDLTKYLSCAGPSPYELMNEVKSQKETYDYYKEKFARSGNFDVEINKSLLGLIRAPELLYIQAELISKSDPNKRRSARVKRETNRFLAYWQSSKNDNAATSMATGSLGITNQAIVKPKRIVNRPIEEVIDDIYNLDKKYLFSEISRDATCKYCYGMDGKLVKCIGGCSCYLHSDCISVANASARRRSSNRRVSRISPTFGTLPTRARAATPERVPTPIVVGTEFSSSDAPLTHITADDSEQPVFCRECVFTDPPKCCICNSNNTTVSGSIMGCSMCGKKYHAQCCKDWPQTRLRRSQNVIESLRCPAHVCHTCVSDDPRGKFQQLHAVARCVRCPATFHKDSKCIPAGSIVLSATQIICPRHSNKTDPPPNIHWCARCTENDGTNVICCDTCPLSLHERCLNSPVEGGRYTCDECESGKMPLYGEMVWAKLNNYRWWPAIILPPSEVPLNIKAKPHEPFDFVVRFFGSHDHSWISRQRVHAYLEGDDGSTAKHAKGQLDKKYQLALEEAKRIFALVKTKELDQRQYNEIKRKCIPEQYSLIVTNRAVPPVKFTSKSSTSLTACNCNPDDEHPCGNLDCLNRALRYECDPKNCPAKKRCENRMFSRRVSPKLEVIYTEKRGFGLVCREAIADGTFVIEYVGEIINDEEFKRRLQQKSNDRDENFYFLVLEKGLTIDAGPKGNQARFMNHSCDPNCESQKWTVNGQLRVGLFALKDIPANTELTFDYNWSELLGQSKKKCYCGSERCTGYIGGKYKEKAKEANLNPEKKPRKSLGKKKTKARQMNSNNSDESPTTSAKAANRSKVQKTTTTKANKRQLEEEQTVSTKTAKPPTVAEDSTNTDEPSAKTTNSDLTKN